MQRSPLAALALAAALAVLPACTLTGAPIFGASSKQRITPGQTTIRQTEFGADGRPTKVTEANAVGAGAESKGKDADLKVDASAPRVELPGVGAADAGKTRTTGSAQGWKAVSPLHVIGALVMIAGLAIAVLAKQIKTGLLISAGGVGIVGVGVLSDTMPWLFALIPAAGIAAWFVWNQWDKARKEKALEAIVGGVETAGDSASAIKAEIAEYAAETLPAVKSVVDSVKRRLRIM